MKKQIKEIESWEKDSLKDAYEKGKRKGKLSQLKDEKEFLDELQSETKDIDTMMFIKLKLMKIDKEIKELEGENEQNRT